MADLLLHLLLLLALLPMALLAWRRWVRHWSESQRADLAVLLATAAFVLEVPGLGMRVRGFWGKANAPSPTMKAKAANMSDRWQEAF